MYQSCLSIIFSVHIYGIVLGPYLVHHLLTRPINKPPNFFAIRGNEVKTQQDSSQKIPLDPHTPRASLKTKGEMMHSQFKGHCTGGKGEAITQSRSGLRTPVRVLHKFKSIIKAERKLIVYRRETFPKIGYPLWISMTRK